MKLETIINSIIVLMLILFFYLLLTRILGHSATDLQLFISFIGILSVIFIAIYQSLNKLDQRITRLETHFSYMKRDIKEIKENLVSINEVLEKIKNKLSIS